MGKSLIPDKNEKEADIVMTPFPLAKAIIDYLPIEGSVLEPCYGTGAFYEQYPDHVDKYWTEIRKGRDFYAFDKKVEWIVSNPPWSIYRDFCKHSYKISNNVAYLITVNHDLALKARIRDMKEHNFGVKEVITLSTPKTNWPQSGFQLGVCWKQKGYKGSIKWSELDWDKSDQLKLL